ncbi:MAG: D-glycero-beta-D-manno-heptose 1-phosphate adenylyltransferase [Candidatus Omnitrophica bacterium]|nr:D-glycero-beta-D-manno-heptose 1-phosphate adenylyltransferase [Candidatus Omnitrophota bacterium]
MPQKNKIKSRTQLIKIAGSLKKRGKQIVFTNGCFDILHKGHIKLLEKSKSLGDVLIVAINSDRSVKKIKGPKRPLNTQQDRAIIVAALSSVDFVTLFDEPTPENLIKKINPDILVKGGDWKKEKIVGARHVESYGGKVYSIKLVKGYSTSQFIHNIIKRFA